MKTIKNNFEVKIISLYTVLDISGSWSCEDYKQILKLCEFDDLDQLKNDELADYAILLLQDYEPEEAARLVLNVRLGSRLNTGQIKNLSYQMQEEKIWEEYQDIALHEQLYYCSVLLYKVFPLKFPRPEAAKSILEIRSSKASTENLMYNLDETLLVRLLSEGMGEQSALNRLFEEQLEQGPFMEAEHIVWQFKTHPINKENFRVELYSSWNWLKPLQEFSHYRCTAFSDRVLETI